MLQYVTNMYTQIYYSRMLLLWSQVEAEVLQALHRLPEDVFDHTPGHPHNLSGSSHQRTVDCGLTPISHCCVHVNGVPGSIQVNAYYVQYHDIDYCKYITISIETVLKSHTYMYHFDLHHLYHLELHHLHHLGSHHLHHLESHHIHQCQ